MPTSFFNTRIDPKPINNAFNSIQPKQSMKTLHLAIAILTRINHFHALKTDFSAFDITRSLREKVSNGEYDISDVDKDTFGGQLVSVVEHESVKDIVKELFKEDLIPDYTPKNFFDSAKGRSYVKYSFSNGAATQPITASAGLAAPASAVSAPKVTAPAPAPSNAVWDKAVQYVKNRGTAPTSMKQIQSRLKGNSVTCKEIAGEFIRRGWTVKHFSNNISESYVRVV